MSGCANCYDYGSAVALTADFYANDGVTPADPTTVTLRVMNPNDVESVLTPTKIATGVYQSILVALVPGVWYYRFEGSGNVVAVQESHFVVASTVFADAAA